MTGFKLLLFLFLLRAFTSQSASPSVRNKRASFTHAVATINSSSAPPLTFGSLPFMDTTCATMSMISSTGGWFRYPIVFWDAYTNNTKCSWSIQSSTSPGHTRLDFDFIDIQGDANDCYDALNIRTRTGFLLHQFCGSKVPLSIIIPRSNFTLRFRSDASITGRGFALSYSSAEHTSGECVSVHQLYSTGGVIMYPIDGSSYKNRMACSWTVTAPVADMFINVFIYSMNIDTCKGGCSCDALIIRDGVSGAVLRRRCGKSTMLVESFNASSLKFQFVSDRSVVSRGFYLSYMFRIPRDPISAVTCGVRRNDIIITPRIVGGVEAVPDSWPWTAFLQLGTLGDYCSGSLIADRWIVTAAHCLFNGLNASDVIARTEAHNLYQTEIREQWIQAEQLIVHAAYNDQTKANDIGLIKLSRPAYATPVCLPVQGMPIPAVGTQFTATGWGDDQNEATDGWTGLRQGQLSLVESSLCQTKFGSLISGMICVGVPEGGDDACQSDSGGPLMLQLSTGHYALFGLKSLGDGCSKVDSPAEYTALSSFVDWIHQQMSQH